MRDLTQTQESLKGTAVSPCDLKVGRWGKGDGASPGQGHSTAGTWPEMSLVPGGHNLLPLHLGLVTAGGG